MPWPWKSTTATYTEPNPTRKLVEPWKVPSPFPGSTRAPSPIELAPPGIAVEARNGGDAFHWFGLAIAHRNLGCLFLARACYQRGCQWVDRLSPRNADELFLRAETEAPIGLPGRAPN